MRRALVTAMPVRVNERDLAVVGEVLRWGALPVAQLAAWYFDAERTAANRVTKLKQAGYLASVREGRHVVLVPTRAGARLRPDLGFSGSERPCESLEHLLAVVEVAAVLLDEDEQVSWITERELQRHQLSGVRGKRGRLEEGLGRRPDGVLVRGSGEWVAIEVELHRKARSVYERIMAWYLAHPGEYAQVRWYVPGAALAATLRSVFADYAAGDFASVWMQPRRR